MVVPYLRQEFKQFSACFLLGVFDVLDSIFYRGVTINDSKSILSRRRKFQAFLIPFTFIMVVPYLRQEFKQFSVCFLLGVFDVLVIDTSNLCRQFSLQRLAAVFPLSTTAGSLVSPGLWPDWVSVFFPAT